MLTCMLSNRNRPYMLMSVRGVTAVQQLCTA